MPSSAPVRCPSCQASLPVAPPSSSLRVKCPRCATVFAAPELEDQHAVETSRCREYAGAAEPTAPQPPLAAALLVSLAPPQRPDELGRLGSYRVLQMLGQGGM